MSSKVLYRKYRPTKLKDVVGQEQVTTTLENALKNNKISHAYLFIGPRGTGKTSVARIFAHAVNNFEYNVEDNYLDIIEIDAASNTGVDNIRELREKAIIAPTNGKYKVYIIDEVHMLTKSASNALLKTLEEPPEHVIFIMATTDAHKVPITISSRTQVFTFKLANPDTMLAHLQAIAKQEKIKITNDALKLIVRRGGGSFRDSMSLLDQVTTLTNKEITANLLESALGLPQEQTLYQLLDAYTNTPPKISLLLKDLLNTGIKPEIIASELIDIIINHPQPAWLNLLSKLPDVQPPFPEAKLLLALLNNDSTGSILTANQPPVQPSANEPAVITQAENQPKTDTAVSTQLDTDHKKPTSKKAKPAEDKPAKSTPEESLIEKNTQPAIDQNVPTISAANFNWDEYLEIIHSESDAIFLQLQKVTYEVTQDSLNLYPNNKFVKTFLSRANNNQVLVKHLNNLTLIIHDIGEKRPPEDPALSKISDIMGGVQEVKGDLPF